MTNADLIEKWQKMTSAFSPCLAVFEDIDTIFEGRKNKLAKGSLNPVPFECFLNVLDGALINDGIFTIITTNHIEKLDSALVGIDGPTRPGRIDRVIEFKIPDNEGRKIIANKIMLDMPLEIINNIIKEENQTGAQFQEKCFRLAVEHEYKINGFK